MQQNGGNQQWVPAWRVLLLTLLLHIGASLLAAGTTNSGSDWPEFLGPDHNGISKETGLLNEWPKGGVTILWAAPVGTGYSAPSVRGRFLVVHHRIGNDEVVDGVEAATGKPIWRHKYPTSYEDPYGYNNGPRCTPLLTDKHCYAFGAEGKLICLELETGKLVWERNTSKDWTVPPAFFGVGSTPILEGDLLIAMVGGQPNSGVVAFDAKTGKTVWENVGAKNWTGQPMIGWPGERNVTWVDYEKQASYSSPVAATIHGKRRVLCLTRQGLVVLDPGNGEVQFSRWFRAQVPDSVNAMNPVVVDDTIFVSAAYYRVGSFLLKVKPDGKAFDEVWRSPVLEIHWTTPIFKDGYLYAFSGRNEPDAHFRCVELKTGKSMWDRDESWPPHSSEQPKVYGRGSAILAENKLIVLGEGGLLGLFKLNPLKAEEVSRWQVPQLGYPCWAAPVLSRKRLYVRSGQHGQCWLICLDIARKE